MYDGVFEVLQWLLFLSAVPPVQLLTGWCVTAKAPPDISAISALRQQPALWALASTRFYVT
ncbi:hypothetical protein BFD11_16795 [Escherichia coli]|nr:hypothetical protein BFD11_16795 [Escherichia coli]